LAATAPLFSRHRLAKGQALLRQGEIWQQVLLVEQGLLRLHFVQPDGREFNKNFYVDGGLVCPLTEAMWAAPSLFAITSAEPGWLWRADAGVWRQALDAAGAWLPLRAELLAGLVSHKLQREHDLLSLDGRARYLDFCRRQPHLTRRTPLRHLASYLGLTDVQLSRIRRGLRHGEVAPGAGQ
jgi:CRP-like cAMP-binding protein